MAERISTAGEVITTIDGMPLKNKETYTVDFVCKMAVVGFDVEAFNVNDVASVIEEKLEEMAEKVMPEMQEMYAPLYNDGISGYWISVDHIRRVEKDREVVYSSPALEAEERKRGKKK